MATNCVIVVNWNSGTYLRKCLHAVLHQSVPVEKIIVVDNASTDASLVEAEDLLPHVQLIRLPYNTGFAAGNNIAVTAAEGCKWIALLNVDAFPEPDWLEQLLTAAKLRPEGALFGSRMIQVSFSGWQGEDNRNRELRDQAPGRCEGF